MRSWCLCEIGPQVMEGLQLLDSRMFTVAVGCAKCVLQMTLRVHHHCLVVLEHTSGKTLTEER